MKILSDTEIQAITDKEYYPDFTGTQMELVKKLLQAQAELTRDELAICVKGAKNVGFCDEIPDGCVTLYYDRPSSGEVKYPYLPDRDYCEYGGYDREYKWHLECWHNHLGIECVCEFHPEAFETYGDNGRTFIVYADNE